MPKIRVLVVDDSVVIRRLLTDELSKDPDLEVVGTAATGKIALSKVEQTPPDVVTMDIEMPEMDGITAVTEIRKTHPKLPIIMFSTLSQRAAKETLEALARGANDYVTKPENVGSGALTMQRVREELIPKIKSLARPQTVASRSPLSASFGSASTSGTRSLSSRKPFQVNIVAIGVSTGGPNALAEVMPLIPKDCPVPILIVQHMPPVFTKCLAERLTMKSQIPIHEGQPGDVVVPGHAWIAPGDYHMVVERKGTQVVLATNQDPPENSCRPAVDVMFRSVAKIYGHAVLAVVLTGMGQDGMRGAEVIREAGGHVIAQDEASSVVWGMPGSVVHAGLQHSILPLSQISTEIMRKVRAGQAQSVTV
ncbi:MAG: chemotaxis response regulator protein-glutamate methylesterase [Nitrospirota bacterium]|nr:chemotaxis response regulator protein-glutamate methylesterase [Nitrospirota bacterium]MDH5585861.1 chemotaxis response regulator protein-glutamate methylesterase [Nitrospirota bacterium]MDH5773698.1 chemotaxis response regulator protein-glutamate methylesterase [Nitrospirota bacterium]